MIRQTDKRGLLLLMMLLLQMIQQSSQPAQMGACNPFIVPCVRGNDSNRGIRIKADGRTLLLRTSEPLCVATMSGFAVCKPQKVCVVAHVVNTHTHQTAQAHSDKLLRNSLDDPCSS